MGQNKRTELLTLTERLTRRKSKQKGGGTKKHGRNKIKCGHYRTTKSVKNKLRKLHRHIARHPDDGCAGVALKNVYSH